MLQVFEALSLWDSFRFENDKVNLSIRGGMGLQWWKVKKVEKEGPFIFLGSDI